VPTAGQWLTTVDVGRRKDATVINTFEISQAPYRRVAFERLERIGYPLIQQKIARRAKAYPGQVIVESNGVGDPLIENTDCAITPFLTTAKSKMQALQALQLLFERHDIQAQWDSRERAALIGCSWDEDHTPDEVMSLAIFASVVESRLNASQWLRRYAASSAPKEESTHA
jgi:5-enolpyruvylshikimate-3-phosphate synthase